MEKNTHTLINLGLFAPREDSAEGIATLAISLISHKSIINSSRIDRLVRCVISLYQPSRPSLRKCSSSNQLRPMANNKIDSPESPLVCVYVHPLVYLSSCSLWEFHLLDLLPLCNVCLLNCTQALSHFNAENISREKPLGF